MELCVAPVALLAVHQWPLEPTKNNWERIERHLERTCSVLQVWFLYIFWTAGVSMIIMDRSKLLYPRILFYSPTENNHSFGYALGLISKKFVGPEPHNDHGNLRFPRMAFFEGL